MKKILVVEKHRMAGRLLAFLLQKQGYVTQTASNKIDAIQCLATGSIDLVIIDMKVSKIEALSLLQEIRQNILYQDLPIVILTVGIDDGSRHMAKVSGADRVLKQPFPIPRLQQVINDLLQTISFAMATHFGIPEFHSQPSRL